MLSPMSQAQKQMQGEAAGESPKSWHTRLSLCLQYRYPVWMPVQVLAVPLAIQFFDYSLGN